MSDEPEERGTRRRRKPGRRKPPSAHLHAGDTMSMSLSMQVRLEGGLECWVRSDVTTTIQESENYLQAAKRLRAVVERTLDDNIGSILSGTT